MKIKTQFASLIFLVGLATAPPVVWSQCTPLVVDTAANGIHLGAAGVGVYFDVNADGDSDHVQWLKPNEDDAFLVADHNDNGIVDNGSELFGVGTTLLADGSLASNGFVALAQYDTLALGGNDDGLITDADRIWRLLFLWRDDNADGVSVPSEMLAPSSARIRAFQIIPKRSRIQDEAGNMIQFWAWAKRIGAPPRTKMVDVSFKVLPDQQIAVCTMRRDAGHA